MPFYWQEVLRSIFFLSLVAERAELLCVYSCLIQPITGSRTLTQWVGDGRSLLVTEHSTNPFSSAEEPEDTLAKSALTSSKFGRTTIMSFFYFGACSPCLFFLWLKLKSTIKHKKAPRNRPFKIMGDDCNKKANCKEVAFNLRQN